MMQKQITQPQQQRVQAIPFDVILDGFISKQQDQLNTVRLLLKNLRDSNTEIIKLRKQIEEDVFVPVDKDNKDDKKE